MKGQTILIVDDEPELVELVEAYLLRDGFQVITATTGPEAIKVAEASPPDLIILDVMLPEVDGMEVCRTLRKITGVPIIFLSARKDERDKIIGLGLGADDYITKPFSPGELMARVKAHLRRASQSLAPPHAEKTLSVGNLTLDLDAYEVRVAGCPVSLTTKEFELLRFLAQHQNTVLTHEQLYNAVWGTDSFGDIRTLMVHIRRLRKKLEDDPANPRIIKTVWGVGYKLEGL